MVRATRAGAHKIVRSLPGRGTQQNSGAALATHPWLLFLHADNRLAPECLDQIRAAVADSPGDQVWGAFRQRIDSPRLAFRFIERGNAARIRFRSMPFGDQAIFVRADLFRKVGGFADIPLMEDVEFSLRLRKLSRPLLLDGPVIVDSRRWQKRGIIRQTLKNWSIQFAYQMGASPAELSKRYR